MGSIKLWEGKAPSFHVGSVQEKPTGIPWNEEWARWLFETFEMEAKG